MVKNIPNLAKNTNIQIKEYKQIPNSINAKKPIPRYNIIQLLKTKDQ